MMPAPPDWEWFEEYRYPDPEEDSFWPDEEDGNGYGFCDCTECPCNVPLWDSLFDVCKDCAEGRHMDEKGHRHA